MITFQLTGDKELDKLFAELPARVERKILRQALKPGAEMILTEAQINSPMWSGEMRDSLRVRNAKRSRRTKNTVMLQILTGAEFFQGKTFYAAFEEFGHKIGSRKLGGGRKMYPGTHFIQKAYEAKANAVKEDALARIAVGIEREAAKSG